MPQMVISFRPLFLTRGVSFDITANAGNQPYHLFNPVQAFSLHQASI
jgi:hypothetical protein